MLDTIYSEPVASAIIVSVAGPLVAAFAIEIARHRQRASLVQGIIVALFLAAGFSLLVTFHLWWMIGVAVIVSIGVAAGLNPRSPKIVRSIATFAISRAIAACLILELVVAAFSSHPWMEREIIVLSSGDRVDCFPLEVQSGYIKVLNTGDREVRILITKDVVSRELSGM